LAERRQERRDAILESARDVFVAKGYAAATLEEICRGAFVSYRDFYKEFPNRDSLVVAIAQDLFAGLHQALTAADATVEPGPAIIYRRIRARVPALVHAMVDDPRVARIALVETVGINPETEFLRRRAHQFLADRIVDTVHDDLRGTGLTWEPEPDMNLALVGAANELVVDWVLTPPDQRASVDDLIDSVIKLADRILALPDV
jgi:AcrR family transcriptional regulator